MNFFDIIIIVFFWGFIFWGLMKGFLVQFLSLSSLLLCGYLAFRFYLPLADKYRIFSGDSLNRAVMFLIIFAVPLLACSILIHFLNRIIKKSPLSFFNRILGGLFGSLKAFVFSAIIIYLILISFSEKNFLYQSRFAPLIARGASAIVKMINDEKKSALDDNFKNDTKEKPRDRKTI